MNDTKELLQQLRDALAVRAIGRGIEILRAHREFLDSLDPRDAGSAELVGYLAQWVDVGFADGAFLRQALARFPQTVRARLPLQDYVYLRTAEGVVAMFEEDFEVAVRHFSILLTFGDDIQDKALVAIGNFWIGRCLRRGGRYQDALNYVVRGRTLAADLNHPKMSAVMQVLEGWIAFQEDRPNEALRILREAEAALADSDDYVTMGNIQSAHGRIARRQGRFQQALRHFERAIELYQKRNPKHPNIARSLVNIAYVKRQIALHLRSRIDDRAAQGRKTARIVATRAASRKRQERDRFQRLHEQALEHLAAALETYRRSNDHRGIGGVHVTYGYLYLDEGGLDRALAEALQAFQLGAQKKDYVLQARARILQSAAEMARFEEQLEEATGRDHPAQSANDFAREAVELAKHTQSRRLLAKAYIALGMTLSSDFYEDLGAVEQCCEKAAALLNPENQDYVWRELQVLKQKLFRTGKIDSRLRAWSQGIVGDTTFQRLSEEFAGIIIPNVWKREGRKISRVAARLSISPKKVRRILRKVGIANRAIEGPEDPGSS